MDKKFDAQTIEKKWYSFWEDEGLFEPSGKGPPYCITIPPPNVTGTLHMGHAFQNTLIDTLIRYQRMRGKRVLWQVGTDHAGIATQMVVERNLAAEGKERRQLGRDQFIQAVWDWKKESSGTITHQLRRLGASVDWKRERFTMDEGFSRAVTEVFVRLYEQGAIYRTKRLINWDPQLGTAVSDLEVRAEEEDALLYYVRYPFVGEDGYMTIATTRPETILADGAVAVHPNDARYKHCLGKKVHVPQTDRIIPVISDNYVKSEFGTGCVKITPAHDFNDYEVGKRHQMEVINLFTPEAVMNENAPKAYQGMDRYAARDAMIKDLKEAGLLVKEEKHKHSPPRGDRSGVILEPYQTDQWFIRMEQLAKDAIAAVQENRTRFVPKQWEKTYFNWLAEIQDWCISRQLWWGHRIPAWYDPQDRIYVGRDEAEVRTKHKIADDVPLRRDEDVLDTWFSSALWTFATMDWPEESTEQHQFNPTSVLVTGFDIIFFWVARMMMMTLAMKQEVPFKDVYIHGLVRDAEGQKMSKSKGNILDPLDIIDGIDMEALVTKRTSNLMQPQQAAAIEKATRRQFPHGIAAHGTDALRFTFCALASNGRDLNFDTARCIGYRNFCNKLWNATRYVLGECTKEGLTHCLPLKEYEQRKLDHIDEWISRSLANAVAQINAAFAKYRFDLAAQHLYQFAWHEYCDWYIELSKPLLAAANTNARRTILNTMLYTLEALLRLCHPCIPFITEEIWQQLKPIMHLSERSIMQRSYPQPRTVRADNRDAVARVRWLQNLITSGRIMRNAAGLPSRARIKPILITDATDEQGWLEDSRRLIHHLLGCAEIKVQSTDRPKPMGRSRIVRQGTLVLPFTNADERQAEIKRLRDEYDALKKAESMLRKKLANADFVTKAPAPVVAEARQRLQQGLDALERLGQNLKEFGEDSRTS